MHHDGPVQLHRKTYQRSQDVHSAVVVLVPVAVVVAAAASASNFVDSSADLLVASVRAPVTNTKIKSDFLRAIYFISHKTLSYCNG